MVLRPTSPRLRQRPACGGNDGGTPDANASSATEAAFNDADVTFAEGMIPHHSQAIDMAQTVSADGTDPAVRDLAEAIIVAQSAEITEMQDLDLE